MVFSICKAIQIIDSNDDNIIYKTSNGNFYIEIDNANCVISIYKLIKYDNEVSETDVKQFIAQFNNYKSFHIYDKKLGVDNESLWKTVPNPEFNMIDRYNITFNKNV